LKQKKAIIISSRVHPGETGASYMMKGVIDYLVGPSIGARILRDNFIFKIIPMMNPDGVILGNTRCSLAGLDLNRMWQDPTKEIHPVIYYVK
jgi:murein tripeptide amidase MpaA